MLRAGVSGGTRAAAGSGAAAGAAKARATPRVCTGMPDRNGHERVRGNDNHACTNCRYLAQTIGPEGESKAQRWLEIQRETAKDKAYANHLPKT
jgi:hypothetical protein